MRLVDAEKLFFEGSSIAFKSVERLDEPARFWIEIGIRRMMDMIAIAPEVEAEPVKHGEWTPDKVNKPTKLFYCSECKGLIQLSHYAYKCYYNYCPTCGAEMDGGDENA